MKRPYFESFREIFLDTLEASTGSGCRDKLETPWKDLGSVELRRNVLEQVREKVRADYGVDFEVNHRLLSVFGTVESAVIQTYHELNTIYLMEKINDKIRAKLN